MSRYERTERLIGQAAQQRLFQSKVAVFGLGGVGSYAAEALMRAGIGQLLLCDGDVVDETNINRQLYALVDSIGVPKAELARARALQINPDATIDARHVFYDGSTCASFDLSQYDYVIDAIDSVTSKLLLIERCLACGTKIICAMGAGNKLDPTKFQLADIHDTKVCPLARVMRRELKQRGIEHLPVVYSEELPHAPIDGARTPASISFVPPVAGMILASAVIRDLIKNETGHFRDPSL